MHLFLLFSFFFSLHPVHVTLMSVEYSEKSDMFNVFLKVYSDDFILDYRTMTGDTSKVDLISPGGGAKKILNRYLNEKIQFLAEGKKLACKIEDYECSDGELKMNLLYDNVRKSKRYIVRNNILTDIYNDQSNLLIFRYGTYEEGIRLTAIQPEKEFNIK